MGQRTETDLIRSFIDRMGELRPQLITFSCHTFDLPVLRYRAMVNRISAMGSRCGRTSIDIEDALDLCHVFRSYSHGARVKLDEICKILLPGPSGIDGSEVDAMIQAGRIAEVAQYCESDVLNFDSG
jgi:3'-5' exonuclease